MRRLRILADMETTERSILATLAYYGALGWPLTAVELTQRLIPPARFGETSGRIDIGTVVVLTERLASDGRIRADSGLYVVGDHPAEMDRHRIQRQASSADKWWKMLRASRWLQAVPYVRMLAASGSLALGSCSSQSDWDMFTIVQARRLYTARLGLLIVAKILGRLRTKGMQDAADKFCFNHFITTDGLSIHHRSIFTAHAIAWLVPFYNPFGYAEKLRQANQWVNDYVSASLDEQFVRRSLVKSRILSALRWMMEIILNTYIGDGVESVLRKWMQRRIIREPATHRTGGRVVADYREIEFHPHSFEAVALRRYNASLEQLGMGQFSERDSGLAHS